MKCNICGNFADVQEREEEEMRHWSKPPSDEEWPECNYCEACEDNIYNVLKRRAGDNIRVYLFDDEITIWIHGSPSWVWSSWIISGLEEVGIKAKLDSFEKYSDAMQVKMNICGFSSHSKH